jgi:hypothetical protein
MKPKTCECDLPGRKVVSSPIDTVDTCQTCGGIIINRYVAKVGTHSSELIRVISGDVKIGSRIQLKRSSGVLQEGIITRTDVGLDTIFIELI